ncbi:hypothetical protein ALO95_101735 [Pseudomonas syringae pv. antirrhini]|uniref:Uncharacterized protein n=5 Tax=Pseudomonas syringae group TaxID=136849 RepID=A0A0Q0D5U3_PSESX|nr:Unknown protein sequence [Pseudomonas syringae pv. maculicola str. M6]KPC05277.1 Unknown protein sequence [Pseudomonas amygdali pv. lachrymans]KPC13253.1 Unknown protein sequence [Pseudomonas syringae pv. maculicola]KPW33367.1 hypothetical protein ALO87_101888 [Pseudomonas syringae pv. apii]KPW51976.1 hypothetical protein ALO88_102060 [Pseudomonas syringae pv. antirrhini]KPW55825.1 hypothetical protein ALO86_101614 [Pseudomonas syringae pv. berberidis]KPY25990.1 hypothetical protein ALO54_
MLSAQDVIDQSSRLLIDQVRQTVIAQVVSESLSGAAQPV